MLIAQELLVNLLGAFTVRRSVFQSGRFFLGKAVALGRLYNSYLRIEEKGILQGSQYFQNVLFQSLSQNELLMTFGARALLLTLKDKKAKGVYNCGKDRYSCTLAIKIGMGFVLKWQVCGPKKDYLLKIDYRTLKTN